MCTAARLFDRSSARCGLRASAMRIYESGPYSTFPVYIILLSLRTSDRSDLVTGALAIGVCRQPRSE